MTLKRLMEQNDISGPDVQKRTEIDRSILSRLKRGQQVSIKSANLIALCEVVCKTNHEKAELIAAHLRDILDLSGSGKELIQIIIAGDNEAYLMHERPLKYGPKLAPSDKATIERLIAKIPTNPAISDSLKNLDALTG